MHQSTAIADVDWADLARQALGRGYSQKQLAAELGLNASNVSRLLSRGWSSKSTRAVRLIELAGGEVRLPQPQEARDAA